MNNRDLIETFINKDYENVINQNMFDRNYLFPKNEVLKYIDSLVKLSFEDVVNYVIDTNIEASLSPINIFQFSSFEDCTSNLCSELIKNGDKGYRYVEIGKMLLNDGKSRNDGALKKYGENASKTANELGLAQIVEGFTFLSCIGNVYNTLHSKDNHKLTSLLIIRSNLFINIIKNSHNKIFDIHWLLLFLSESTQKRRISNIKYLINFLREENNEMINGILDNIVIDNKNVNFGR